MPNQRFVILSDSCISISMILSLYCYLGQENHLLDSTIQPFYMLFLRNDLLPHMSSTSFPLLSLIESWKLHYSVSVYYVATYFIHVSLSMLRWVGWLSCSASGLYLDKLGWNTCPLPYQVFLDDETELRQSDKVM